MIKQEDLTIIIPHFGSTPEQRYALEECLISLAETVPNTKKIIAINGRCYKEGFFIIPKHPQMLNNVEVIELEAQGQCKAVNAAAAIVSTDWLMVTNDDMIYAPGWLEKLTVVSGIDLKLYPAPVLCISPKLVEPRPGAPTFETYFCGGAGGDFDLEKWLAYEKQRPLSTKPVVTGFNLPFIIKKKLWDIVEGYDINYDPWGSNSDSDLEYKIRLAGIQPYQNQNCAVYHFGQTSGTFEPQNNSYWGKNFQYFIDKWGFPRTDNGIWEANFEMPEKERIFRPWWEGFFNR